MAYQALSGGIVAGTFQGISEETRQETSRKHLRGLAHRAASRPGKSGLAALGLVALTLAGCGSSGPKDPLANVPAPCPNVALLGDAADLTRYAGQEQLTSMVLDARLTGFQAKCDYAPNRSGIDVTLRLALSAERGPAATGNTAQLPYMVAVVTGDETDVLARAAYTAQVEFPANVSRVQTQGEELSIRIPGGVETARNRRVLLGFVLTPEELAVNRRRGPRG